MAKREWIFSRNCSISPRQLVLVYVALCLASFTIAIIFTMRGAWYILGFAIVEMSAVALAFFMYARHATDREHIALIDDWLIVELIQKEQVRQFRLDSRRTRIELPVSPGGLIGLETAETRVEVGRYLTEWKRREFARELKRVLASGR
jgi:uncharacterized membrane protein